jgi:predicted enzyme related to lactoylglutathione lyase
MKITGLSFVRIPVRDMRRARAFYEDVLGLNVGEEMMHGQWIEYELGNNTLAIASVGHKWRSTDEGTAAALEVDNFEEAIRRLIDRQVPFAIGPRETPCCRMAIIQDPDGNKIAVHKLKSPEEKQPCP